MRRDDAYLLDMLLSARDALEFISGLTYAEFEASQLRQNAVVKSVEIVGEAANRVSSGRKEALSHIPWAEIVGMRNRLVHAYFEIDIDLVWKTVQEDLPVLIAELERVVPRESDSD